MTLPDVHLAEEALAAYVDGVLSPAADERAGRHLRGCPECRAAVDAQREAKALLTAAPDPQLPAGLLAKLLDVPMTADLGGGDRVLAVVGDELGWATDARVRPPEEPRLVERSRTAVQAGPGAAPSGRRSGGAGRPAGTTGPGRPARSPAAVARRVRRGRRGLAVSLAGLAFGVLASAASASAPGSAAPARPGTAPGSSPAQLVVGTSTPMEAGTIRFNQPAGAALLPARAEGR